MIHIEQRAIVDGMDVDKDGGVSVDELKEWIGGVARRRREADVEERWQMHGGGQEDTLEVYLEKNYGLLSQCKLSLKCSVFSLMFICIQDQPLESWL